MTCYRHNLPNGSAGNSLVLNSPRGCLPHASLSLFSSINNVRRDQCGIDVTLGRSDFACSSRWLMPWCGSGTYHDHLFHLYHLKRQKSSVLSRGRWVHPSDLRHNAAGYDHPVSFPERPSIYIPDHLAICRVPGRAVESDSRTAI